MNLRNHSGPALLAGSITLYAVVAILGGWGLQIDGLVRHASTATAMVPATALGFLIVSVGLLGAMLGIKPIAYLASALTLVVAGLATFGQSVGWHEAVFYNVSHFQAHERMALVTATGFGIAALALIAFVHRAVDTLHALTVFGLSAAGSIAMMILGGLPVTGDIPFLAGISPQTALLFSCLFLTIMLASLND